MKIRLRHVAQINPLSKRFDRLPDDEQIAFLPMENVWPGDLLDLSQRRPKSVVATGYTRFETGDVVVPKITPTFEASRSVLIPEIPWSIGTGTTELHVVRPSPEIDPRFLLYIFHCHDFLKIGESEMYGVAGQKRIPDDLIRDWTIELLPLDEQRRIADFLDAETARISRLTALRESQTIALDTHYQSYLSEIADSLCEQHGTVKVRHVLRKIEQGWSPQCEDRLVDDDGWGVVKAGCVNGGVFDSTQHKALPSWTDPELRYRLRPGDLLMSRASGSVDLIGSIAVLPEDIPKKLLLCDKIYRLRMDHTRMIPDFTAFMLRTFQVREQIKLGISGAEGMANNLPTATVTNLPLPDAPLNMQPLIVSNLSEKWLTIQAARQKLREQLRVLAERRQALITAAVTGKIDVTTAGRAAEAITD